LTWVTFPLWIVLFSVLTYALAAPGRPDVEKKNVLSICDIDSETGTLRVSYWCGVYSPVDTRYEDDILCPFGHYSWYGLPGSGLGGMAPKTVSPPVWLVGSEQNSYDRGIANVPIQAHSTKSFFGQYYAPSATEFFNFFYFISAWLLDEEEEISAKYATITALLSDEEGVPIGTIEIPQDSIYALERCILAYGRWIIELGDIEPGQTIKLTKTTPRRDLRDLLIPPKARENEGLRGLATYNPQSTDLEYIVRVMSLHRALGGYESTGLHCAYQPSLDMSELLSADRVLLLGVVVSDNVVRRHRETQIFRQSFPITLSELSPRLRIRRDETGGGELDEKVRPAFQEERR
jgi:hypothetical protein